MATQDFLTRTITLHLAAQAKMCILVANFKVSTTNRSRPRNFSRMSLTSTLCKVSGSSVSTAFSLRKWNPFDGLPEKFAGKAGIIEVTLKRRWIQNECKNTVLAGYHYRLLTLISSHEAVFKMLLDEKRPYSHMDSEAQDALIERLEARFPLLAGNICPCCDIRPTEHKHHLRTLAALDAIGGKDLRNLRHGFDSKGELRLQYLTRDAPQTWQSFKDTRHILRIGGFHKYIPRVIAKKGQKKLRAQATISAIEAEGDDCDMSY